MLIYHFSWKHGARAPAKFFLWGPWNCLQVFCSLISCRSPFSVPLVKRLRICPCLLGKLPLFSRPPDGTSALSAQSILSVLCHVSVTPVLPLATFWVVDMWRIVWITYLSWLGAKKYESAISDVMRKYRTRNDGRWRRPGLTLLVVCSPGLQIDFIVLPTTWDINSFLYVPIHFWL